MCDERCERIIRCMDSEIAEYGGNKRIGVEEAARTHVVVVVTTCLVVGKDELCGR